MGYNKPEIVPVAKLPLLINPVNEGDNVTWLKVRTKLPPNSSYNFMAYQI